jgi:hypothetical protein
LPENLAVLSETLTLELEFERREKAVGRFSADILCKELGTDRRMLIENQLERTDHCHLGQLLTYAAGLQAVTIVWIAARFTEEHRAALDWLNQITDETVRFFGLEVELWRIGTSPAAPKFNIIAKPNDWSRSMAQAARSLEEGEPSGIRLLQQRYWAPLNFVLDAKPRPVMGHRKPQLAAWMSYSAGPSYLYLAAVMIRPKRTVRAPPRLVNGQRNAASPRQDDRCPEPAGFTVCKPQFASMRFNDRGRDGEPQTHAPGMAAARAFETVKGLSDPREFVLRNAGAGIVDPDFDCPGSRGKCCARAAAIFDRIVDQIDDRPP